MKIINDSCLGTNSRWIVEAKNERLKSIFILLQNMIQIQYLSNLGNFYRKAGAINRYPPTHSHGRS